MHVKTGTENGLESCLQTNLDYVDRRTVRRRRDEFTLRETSLMIGVMIWNGIILGRRTPLLKDTITKFWSRVLYRIFKGWIYI